MAAPYQVTITISDAEGKEMTVLTQRLDQYEELVAYQRALASGIFGMADQAVRLKSGNAGGQGQQA